MAVADGGGKTAPLAYQEPIRGDTQSSVMVKSAPTPAFIVAQPQLLFEFLIIALEDPAMFGQLHQRLPRRLAWRRSLRPFDQKPFLRARFRALFIAMGRTDPHGGKTRAQDSLTPLAPTDALPCCSGQSQR